MAAMEDVLEVYPRPYDPLCPVICIDETNKQLIKEERTACEPGKPGKADSVYVRNGVADVFMISEPLAARRLQNRFRIWRALRNRSVSGQSNEMLSVKK